MKEKTEQVGQWVRISLSHSFKCKQSCAEIEKPAVMAVVGASMMQEGNKTVEPSQLVSVKRVCVHVCEVFVALSVCVCLCVCVCVWNVWAGVY